MRVTAALSISTAVLAKRDTPWNKGTLAPGGPRAPDESETTSVRGFQASVYGAQATPFDESNDQAVEMLRFVTGYGTGLDAVVDATPYTPLIEMIAAGEAVKPYVFIDTWVGREHGTNRRHFLESTGQDQCTEEEQVTHDRSQGNGWGFSAELLLWRKPDAAVDVRPRETLTLSSGPLGEVGTYKMGFIWYHKGHPVEEDTKIHLDHPARFEIKSGSKAQVYHCPEGGMAKARQMAIWREKALNSDASSDLFSEIHHSMTEDQLVQIKVLSVDKSSKTVICEPVHGMEPEVGLPLFYSSEDVHSPSVFTSGRMQTVGKITEVNPWNFTAQINMGCLPNHGRLSPRIWVPRDGKWEKRADDTVSAFRRLASAGNSSVSLLSSGAATASAVDQALTFYEVRDGAVQRVETVGDIKEDHGYELGKPVSDHKLSLLVPNGPTLRKDLCVVEVEHTNLLFDRVFESPIKAAGDRVLLQMVVTGHGWETTREKCGEFCHALYDLSFNGKAAHEVSLWRDDCDENPTGQAQAGTWQFGRNGWCPGSVEPGIYIDVTDHLLPGKNRLQVGLQVMDSATGTYTKYFNVEGWKNNDAAMFVVGMTLSVYPKEAVAAVRQQSKAFTPAERALRESASNPEALSAVAEEASTGGEGSLLQVGGAEPSPADARLPPSALRAMLSTQGTRTAAGLALVRSTSFLQVDRWGKRTVSNTNWDAALPRTNFSGSCQKPVGIVSSAHSKDGGAWVDSKGHAFPGRLMNTESSGPWFCYDTWSNNLEPEKTTDDDLVRVPLFTRKNVHGGGRVGKEALPADLIPKDFKWGRAFLHIRLDKPVWAGIDSEGKPYEQEFDDWDRVGSFGLQLPALGATDAATIRAATIQAVPKAVSNTDTTITEHSVAQTFKIPSERRSLKPPVASTVAALRVPELGALREQATAFAHSVSEAAVKGADAADKLYRQFWTSATGEKS